jgi:protocatechuate 3,4-dioxygenase beta subunit
VTSDRLRRIARALASALAVTLGMGGLPGAALRAVVYDAGGPPIPGERAKGVVDVQVHEADGSRVIAGASVRAFAIIDERAYLVLARDTDSAGRAHLEGLPRGEAWIIAEATGRARASTHLVVSDEVRFVDLGLALEHAIDVVVKDEEGAPVQDAEIEVASSKDLLPVGSATDRKGVSHARRLGPGPWRVSARAPGFEEATGRADRDGETVALVLRKLGAFAVHVVDPDDRPAAGARVAVAGAALWPPRMAATDDHGDVRIGGLMAGTYALRATRESMASPIELGIGLARGEEKPLTLKLGRGHFVVVRVTDGEGEDADPIPGARLTLAEGGLSPFPLEATSDAKGRARLGPVSAGGATLSGRADGFVSRGTVSVPDPPPAETRLVLVRAGALTGRVVDARGYPVDGATVEVAGTDPTGQPIFDDPRRANFRAAHFDAMLSGPAPFLSAGELGVVPGPVPPIPHAGMLLPADVGPLASRGPIEVEPWVTRSDGTFRAAPVTPGRVRAIVRHPQFVEAESAAVTLAPGGEAHVDIVMHEGGSLEGVVLDARDRPVEGARIYVSAAHGSLERTTRSASDGTFAFASLPDAVSLSVGTSDDEPTEVRMSVAVPEGGRKEVSIHLPDPRDPLPVTVVDDGGWPVETAQVSVSSLSADSPLRSTVFTDEHGEATIKRARGLPLRVEVRAPGHAPTVQATDGAIDALRIELSPAESASGEVVESRGGAGIAGADVTLYTDLGARRVRTDAHGAFSLSELAPGPARLRVRAPGFAPVLRAVTIPPSGGRRPTSLPRVELESEASVEGDVLDADGKPIAGARVARDHVPTWLLVGSSPDEVAVTDARGRFVLHQLPEGSLTLEAYSPEVGRAHVDGVKVVAGRVSSGVHIVVGRSGAIGEAGAPSPAASGGVAVTLGETGAPVEVVIVSVVEGSEAERSGLAPGDVLMTVDGEQAGSMEHARARLSGPVADDVVVTIRRGDQTRTMRVAREVVRR